MAKSDMLNWAEKVNWILLGLTMLVAGLLKVFVITPEGVSGMFAGLGFPAPTVLAWIVIVAEIVSGALILAKWRLKYVVYVTIIILIVATFTANLGNYVNMLIHLALAANYWRLGVKAD